MATIAAVATPASAPAIERIDGVMNDVAAPTSAGDGMKGPVAVQ